MLNLIVCIKAVPDPGEADKIRIDPASKTLTRGDIPVVLNPLDKNALEAAFQIKSQVDAHITVISMGPPAAAKVVKECLALGADQGFLLSDRAFGGAGLDVLMGNTGGDRLIDWVGEFNSYIVPFAPFGIATVSRQVPPWLFEFLYGLSASQGAPQPCQKVLVHSCGELDVG